MGHSRAPSLDHVDHTTPPPSRPASPVQHLEIPHHLLENEDTSGHLLPISAIPHQPHHHSSHPLNGRDDHTPSHHSPLATETMMDGTNRTAEEVSHSRTYSSQHPLGTTPTPSVEKSFEHHPSPPSSRASSIDPSKHDEAPSAPHLESASSSTSQFRFPFHQKKSKGGRPSGNLRRNSSHSLPHFLSEAFHHHGVRPVGVVESQRYMDLEDYLSNP